MLWLEMFAPFSKESCSISSHGANWRFQRTHELPFFVCFLIYIYIYLMQWLSCTKCRAWSVCKLKHSQALPLASTVRRRSGPQLEPYADLGSRKGLRDVAPRRGERACRSCLRLCVCMCGVVWCGVVWCGVVWCGVVWCGVVWCGVVWCGVVWCGVVWCGVVWCGVLWCGVVCVCVLVCVC